MDRAQRLRPRHHADRAVRVDDRHADLPGQPRAGQAPRRAARAARHRAPRPDGGADERALPAGGAARSAGRDPGGHHRSRDAAHGIRRVGRVPSRDRFLDPAPEAGGLRRRARRAVQDDRGGGWRGQAAGSGPLSVRDAAPDQRCALPGLRGRPGEPAGPSRHRRPDCARRGSRSRGSAAAVGGEPGGRRLGRGGRARRPHRRLQLRRRRDRAPMSGGICGRGDRRQTDAMAAVPDRQPRLAPAQPERPTRIRPRSTRSRRRRWALWSASSTPRARSARAIGVSDGTPGQVFPLRFSPVLPLADGQILEVREPGSDRWHEWAPGRVVCGIGTRGSPLQARHQQRRG